MNWKKYNNKLGTFGLWLAFGISIFLLLVTFTGINKILILPLEREEAPQSADVIIILGGGVVKDTRSLPWSVQERARRGIEIYRQGYADTIIVAGGLVKGESYTESEIMKAYIKVLGVAPGDVFEENASKSTYENALNSLAIMDSYGWETALLVTSDYHTERACRVFEKLKADITCISASPEAAFADDPFRRLVDARSIFREYVAVIYYFIRGYL